MCHDFSAKASVTLSFLKRSKRTRKENAYSVLNLNFSTSTSVVAGQDHEVLLASIKMCLFQIFIPLIIKSVDQINVVMKTFNLRPYLTSYPLP